MPANLMPSMSDSSISSKRDEVDGLRRSQSAENVASQVMEFSDDDEMDYYENTASKPKASKGAKPKSRPATRKSARKHVKTEFSDYSD